MLPLSLDKGPGNAEGSKTNAWLPSLALSYLSSPENSPFPTHTIRIASIPFKKHSSKSWPGSKTLPRWAPT